MDSNYWTEEDRRDLEMAKNYRDFSNIALRVLGRMPEPRGELSGPITTGGVGTVEGNLTRFGEVIQRLQKDGIHIFDVMPFEMPIQEMRKKLNHIGYDTVLLNEFYLPLFESGLFRTVYFLPDWETSVGSRWEHEQAKRLGLAIVYLGEYE